MSGGRTCDKDRVRSGVETSMGSSWRLSVESRFGESNQGARMRLNRALIVTAAALSLAIGVRAEDGAKKNSGVAKPVANKAKFANRVPSEAIQGKHRKRVLEIIKTAQFHRHGPVEVFPCSPELFQWLLEHPVWVGRLWKEIGVPAGDVENTDDGYRCKDAMDTIVDFHLLVDKPEVRMLYCVGESRVPPLPGRLKAEMVLVHHYHFTRQPSGQYYLVQQLEGYVRVEGPTLKTIAKMSPVMCEQFVDQCLQDLMIFFSVMGRAIHLRQEWALTAIAKIERSFPAEEGEAFRKLVRKLPPSPNAQTITPAHLLELPTEKNANSAAQEETTSITPGTSTTQVPSSLPSSQAPIVVPTTTPDDVD